MNNNYKKKYKKYKKKYLKLKRSSRSSRLSRLSNLSKESLYNDYYLGEKNKSIDSLPYDDNFVIRIAKNDKTIQDILKKGYLFEKYVTMCLYSFCKKDDIIIDVGANVGCVTIPCAKWFKVYAFEPFLITFNALKYNVEKNAVAENVILYNNAVGHEIMETTLAASVPVIDKKKIIIGHQDLNQEQDKINYGAVQLGSHGQKIKMITLNSLINNIKKVSAIKVDVEGAETLVFYGAQEIIKRDLPLIIFEKNWQTITDDMIKSLDLTGKPDIRQFDIVKYCKSLGYKDILYLHLEDYVLIPPNRQRVIDDPKFQYVPVDDLPQAKIDKINTHNMNLFKMIPTKW
jgi:FkbM family methyltransferase